MNEYQCDASTSQSKYRVLTTIHFYIFVFNRLQAPRECFHKNIIPQTPKHDRWCTVLNNKLYQHRSIKIIFNFVSKKQVLQILDL